MRTSLGPSTRRAEGHARLSPQGAPAADQKKKKAPVSAGAWEEARALIWKHRHRLSLGMALMLVNRLAGLVLPLTSKYLMDDVVGQQNWDLLPTLAMAAGAATLVDASTSFANSAGSRRGRAARDHRHAQRGRGARDAPADPLLRLDQDRHAHLAHHDRRRRHPEPGRHGPRAADRLGPDRDHGAGHPLLSELAADGRDDPRARHVRRRHGARPSSGCGRCSASAARSTPKSPAGSPKRSAASASSRPIRRRSARSWSSPAARTGCSATSRTR